MAFPLTNNAFERLKRKFTPQPARWQMILRATEGTPARRDFAALSRELRDS
jgi:hypothetical protein